MEIEFDTAKDAANRAKHGLSLAFGARVFDDPDVLILPTIRQKDEEERHKAVGMIDGKLYTAVHVWRGETVRFISVRRSNDSEERAYHCD
ncbi:MAG: hypothetical protein RLZZ501_566 [Pseudomonadota bacterium]